MILIGSKSISKLVPVTIPLIGLIDIGWALSLALGLLAGFFARVGLNVSRGHSCSEIVKDSWVSLLILGGSLITTLYIARLMNADELTIAAIAFVVVWRGIEALNWLDEKIFKIGKRGE